jgi:integrase
MAVITLTDLALKNLKLEKRATYFDASLKGFAVRVTTNGVKTFVIVHGKEHDRKWETIGRYDPNHLTLAKARKVAGDRLAQIRLGLREERPALTFEEAFDLFKQTHTSKNRERTAKDTERLIQKHLIPRLRRKSIADIDTHDVTQIIDKLLPTPGTCIHVFAAARLMFRWAAQRRLIDRSPIDNLPPPTTAVARARVLSSDELVIVYRKALAARFTGGLIVRLLILTGQRRGEISALRAEYLDPGARTITFPAELTKNGRTHTIPYGDTVAGVLEKAEPTGYLFPARGTEGDRPYSGWSKLKTYLKADIAPWTLHDLRRTFATNLAALDVAPHVIERILNHVSGTISGVGAIYNRHRYMDEMRDAMQRYESWLQALLSK